MEVFQETCASLVNQLLATIGFYENQEEFINKKLDSLFGITKL